MLRIRLFRVGKKKRPAYRIVVADSRSPRDGAFLKIIGHYNPLTDPATLVIKEEEAIHWLQKGAQPSETAAKLLSRVGVMEKAGRQPYAYPVKAAASKAKRRAPGTAQPAATTEPAAAEAPEAQAEPESAPAQDETQEQAEPRE